MFANMGTTIQTSTNNNVDLMDGRSQQQPQPQQQEQGAVLPGFRFHPTDEELVAYYLRRKVMHKPPSVEVITQLDIYKFDPWDLPKMSLMKGEKEWYFFCPRDRKYRNSARPNRVTGAGFWKATGTDRPIYSGDASKCIGLKKSLVFYTGRAAKSTKTDWMMHEFRMPASSEASNLGKVRCEEVALQQDLWAVCRIFKKTPLAQRHGSQPWTMIQSQHTLVDTSMPSLVMQGHCTANADLEHDSSSQERSDTTSEGFEVDGVLMPHTVTQDPLQNYLPQRDYTTAATHVQQPHQQLKQEQSTATWPVTMASSMEDLLQDTSSVRNMHRPSSHIPSEIYTGLEMPNTVFVPDVPSSMRGALEFVSCIINPSQSGSQFVGSNFDNNSPSRESINLSHHQGSQPMDNICRSAGLSTPVMDTYRLTQQIPQGQLAQPFFSTQPWD